MPLRHFRSAVAKDFNALATGKVTRTSADITTTSTTFVDATEMSVTLTIGARRCLVTVSASGKHSASDTICMDITIDGVRQGQDLGLIFADSLTGQNRNLSFSYVTSVLAAGSHTFKLQHKTATSGTMTLYASTTTCPLILSVVELPH